MRKTQMNLPNSGCASETIWTTWDSIKWDKVARAVKSLQARIVKAVKAKHFHKAKALLLLLTRSFYGKLLAVLRGERESNLPDLLDPDTLRYRETYTLWNI